MTVQERPAFKISGFVAVIVYLALLAADVWLLVRLADDATQRPLIVPSILLALLLAVAINGFVTVQPNEARALVFLGRYVGTVRDEGFYWVNPLTLKKHVSLRTRNFNSASLKVNDASGNPIEIAAVVVWSVVDSAKALFDVEHYEQFVSIQAETAIRTLASRYPYDVHDDDHASLRGSPDEVGERLRHELQQRLDVAGVKIHDARITHLAYAPEIAQAMLRRQQAQAVIAARQQIVEGAVGMVEMALRKLSEHGVVELDEERKAAMVSNLLVVLVGESDTQPIINAGTLY